MRLQAIENHDASGYALSSWFDGGTQAWFAVEGAQIVGLRAFLSRRIVLPHRIVPGAMLVDGERIQAVVALVEVPAHANRHILPKTVEAVAIEYDPLPPLFTIAESERQAQIIWGTDNVFKAYLVEKGDVDGVWAKADYIVEGEYTTGAQEQLYIENNGVIASFDRDRGVTVWGSLQCPYYVHKALMKLCDLPEEKVRVVQMETGGAFGGKEDYPSIIAVELYIEQGPVLEHEGKQLGVVERIAAPASLRLAVEGAGGHAGGVRMADRRDALCAAAELILAIEHAARTSGAIDTVATVGICDVFPGAVNSIPSRVQLSVDVRDTDLARRDGLIRALDEVGRATAEKRHVKIHSDLLNADAPAESGPAIVSALEQSCEKHGFSYLPMTSRAYHDSLFISRIAPVAILFIPCRHG